MLWNAVALKILNLVCSKDDATQYCSYQVEERFLFIDIL